jgi:hypothetical protein
VIEEGPTAARNEEFRDVGREGLGWELRRIVDRRPVLIPRDEDLAGRDRRSPRRLGTENHARNREGYEAENPSHHYWDGGGTPFHVAIQYVARFLSWRFPGGDWGDLSGFDTEDYQDI